MLSMVRARIVAIAFAVSLSMPREYAADKGIPFSQVKRGR